MYEFYGDKLFIYVHHLVIIAWWAIIKSSGICIRRLYQNYWSWLNVNSYEQEKMIVYVCWPRKAIGSFTLMNIDAYEKNFYGIINSMKMELPLILTSKGMLNFSRAKLERKFNSFLTFLCKCYFTLKYIMIAITILEMHRSQGWKCLNAFLSFGYAIGPLVQNSLFLESFPSLWAFVFDYKA